MSQERFRQQFAESFDLQEFQTLCFDLTVDYDSLPGAGKTAKVRDLISHMQRTTRLDELLTYLEKHRPGIEWRALLPAAELPSQEQSEWLQDNSTAFVGQTEWGPLRPLLIDSWEDYLRLFGYPTDPSVSFLGYAVRGFFDNGGRRAYVTRIVGQAADVATATIATENSDSNMVVTALSPGTWGNGISVQVRNGTRTGIRITVTYSRFQSSLVARPQDPSGSVTDLPAVQEDYDNLGIDPNGPNFLFDVVARRSQLISIEWEWELARPENGTVMLAGGSDGHVSSDQYVGDLYAPPAERLGLAALADLEDVALVCIPDHVHPSLAAPDRQSLLLSTIVHCERQGGCLALLSAAGDQTDVETKPPPPDTSYAAMYHPWIRVPHVYLEGESVALPAVGHIAGAYTRHDGKRGVHLSPAPLSLRGLTSAASTPGPLISTVTPQEEDMLARKGINVLRARAADGSVQITTALTCSIDSSMQHIGLRRFTNFLVKSLILGLKWVYSEENNSDLWAEVVKNITDFLHTLWELGALWGESAEEAFFVRCDEQTMTADDIDNGRLVVLLAATPTDAPGGVALSITLDTTQPGSSHISFHNNAFSH